MGEIPDDIREAASMSLRLAITTARAKNADGAIDIIAKAILAERECCAAIANSIATDVRNSAVQRITAGTITTLIKARSHPSSPDHKNTELRNEA
jgi:capsular polysaccharide biosynthesis protein